MGKSFLFISLLVHSVAFADQYTVTERQLEYLNEIINRLNTKLTQIETDFGTREVMPRDRDRRDFKRDVAETQNHTRDSVNRWLDRVRNGSSVIVPPPTFPPPPDVTLNENFTETSGYSTFYAGDYQKAANTVQAQCTAWRDQVIKNTAGTPAFSQCSGPEQIKMADGTIGAQVRGQIKISFANLNGAYAPVRNVTPVFSNSSGYSTYYAGDIAKARTASESQCQAWLSGVRAQSKGVLLYQSCGAPQIVKGHGGALFVAVSGQLGYTYHAKAAEPNTLTQQFTNTSGYSTYYEGDVKKAAAASDAQCRSWLSETIRNSASTAVLASCAGPELVANGNIDVRYSGLIVLLP